MKTLLDKKKKIEILCINRFFYITKALLKTTRISLFKKLENSRKQTYFKIIIRYFKLKIST